MVRSRSMARFPSFTTGREPVTWKPEASRPARPEGLQQSFEEGHVIERIEVVALRRLPATPIAHRGVVVEAIDRGPNGLTPGVLEERRNLVCESRLARRIDSVDSDPHRMGTLYGEDPRDEILDEFRSIHSRVHRPLQPFFRQGRHRR